MENTIKFNNIENSHKCHSEQEGDWITFRCPVCEDYERRINVKTGEVKSNVGEENQVLHYGFSFKAGFDVPFSPQN